MKTTTTTYYYRGHEIAVTRHEANGGEPFWTASNDVTDTFRGDSEGDALAIYNNASTARKTAEADMEEIMGRADENDLMEAACDLANENGSARTNSTLLHVIQSIRNAKPSTDGKAATFTDTEILNHIEAVLAASLSDNGQPE